MGLLNAVAVYEVPNAEEGQPCRSSTWNAPGTSAASPARGGSLEGVVFSNGWCALHWLTKYNSVEVYQSVDDLEAVHGHGEATKVILDKER